MNLPQDVVALGSLFEARGYAIRVVGGWVRDNLRGLTPKDLDLCTTALPDQMIALCRGNGLAFTDAGVKHGTVGIIVNSTMYEVTTLRVDIETDGRHAVVEFTDDWRADAARRDFTINAMSVDFTGNVYDYFDGKRDLTYRRVRFVGDAYSRIEEDYLRILRYYRFKGLLGDDLDERETEAAITCHVARLADISVERIWSEMSRILAGPNLNNVLMSMWVCLVFPHIGLDDVDMHRINHAVETRALTDNPVTVLAALTDTAKLAEKWRMSRDEKTLLEWLLVHRNVNYERAD